MKLNDDADDTWDKLAAQAAEAIAEGIDAAVLIARKVLDRDDVFELHAKGYRKTFLALVAAGFTEEQAIQILCRQGSAKFESK